MNQLRFYLIVLPFLALAACHPEPIEGGKEIAREAQLRKIQRITPEQIFSEAYKAGDSVTTLAARLQLARINKALQESGVAEAMKYCSQPHPALDSALAFYGATVKRVSQKPRNPGNAATGQTAQLLDAYHYNAENNLPLEPNVQHTPDGKYIYTKAITINNESCLKCHGTLGQELTAENNAIIKAVYPTDQATGYKAGDLRGMWQVTFMHEGLAKSFSLNAQKKKRKR